MLTTAKRRKPRVKPRAKYEIASACFAGLAMTENGAERISAESIGAG